MIKDKRLIFKLVLLMGIVACLVAVLFCCAPNTYADELDSDNGGIVATYNDPCEDNRLSVSKISYPENQGRITDTGGDANTFHVDQTGVQPGGVKHFNRLDVTREGITFTIYYDFRGYLGDISRLYDRASHVQYFFNSSTQEMYIIGFAGSSYDFNTYNYAWQCDTVFCDAIDYNDGCKTSLNDQVKTIWLDTKIQNISRCTFQKFHNLEKVDILGGLYDSSSLYDLCEFSFECCHKQGAVSMNMLKAKHMKYSMKDYLEDYAPWHWATDVMVD